MKGIEALLAGHTLAGRYRIEEVIGRGGFAAVYRASDENLRRTVAVKVIMVSAPDAESGHRLRARFHREARAAASLSHPHVVTIYDFGTDAELGLDFLVMELLRGEDLASRLLTDGALPVPDAIRILRQAAEGVAAGHRAGLIHRDVKPGNVFLAASDEGPLVKVLDFGIAQIVAAEHTITQLTHGGNPLSPAYASPEQLRGERVLSPASDVYSLGVIGYEMLSGERVFGGRGDSLDRSAAPPLRERRPEVPAEVSEVIARAMETDPALRFADAGQLAEALDAALHAPPAAAADHRVLPPVYRARERPRLPEEPASPVPRAGRRGPARLALALLALALLAGVGWWVFAADREPERGARVLAAVEAEPGGGAEAGRRAATPAVPEPAEAGGLEETPTTAGRAPASSSGGAPAGWSRNAQALHAEGLELFQSGSFAGAAERLRVAVRLEPDNAHFRNNFAWALFRAGEVEEAAAELERVLRQDPRRAIAHANLGEVRLEQGDTAEAIAAYRRFLELNGDARRERIARDKLQRIGGRP